VGDEAPSLLSELLPRCTFPPPGKALPCAVSGGADSLALLLLAAAAGCDVTAIHVDHGLRPGSAAEAGVVEAAAARVGARFESRRVTVAPGPNLEARARAARFAVLPPDVATGHTMDDQAETILVNLLRGAGADGLAGMAPGPRHPLLGLRRHETHALCAATGLVPVCDASNDDPAFVRNRVRHELLPLCSAVAGRDLVPVLARQAAVLRDEAALLESLSADALPDPADARAVAAAPRATSGSVTPVTPDAANAGVPAWAGPDVGPVLVDADRVARRVAELGAQITADYADEPPLLIAVLKGAMLFMSDLCRAIELPVDVDFMAVSSYGSATKTSGVVRIVKDLDSELEGRHVLVVEDIIDSGLTLNYLRRYLTARQPKSVEICALLVKEGEQRVDLDLRYIGFTIPPEFVVGYGLDVDERFRNLRGVHRYKSADQ